MFQFLTSNLEAFGLDISDFSIKVLFLKKKKGFLKSINFSEKKIDPGIVENGEIKDEKKLADLIKEVLKEAKIKTKYTILSLPENKVFLEIIQMPKLRGDELRSAIVYEAENYIPFPLEKIILDYQVLPLVDEKSEKLNIMLVAFPKDIANSYLRTLKLAGLFPLVFEPESFAISRALIEEGKDHPPILLIDIGATKSNFIIYSDLSIKLSFSSPISSNTFTEIIAKNLNISFSEAEKLKIKYGLEEKIKMKIDDHKPLFFKERGKIFEILIPALVDFSQQIKKYIYYWETHDKHHFLSSHKKISKILLSGGGANLNGLREFLSLELKIPVELGNPLVNIIKKQVSPFEISESLKYTTVLGLVQRKIEL
jgi:type IV pilus assembly protein PilM